MKKIGVIVNPNAGRKLAPQRAEELQELLSLRGMKLSFHYTEAEEDLELVISQMVPEVEQLVVMGGDGTVNEIVNGIVRQEIKHPLSIYPMGTVNDFATYLQIPKNIRDFSAMIHKNQQRKVDVGLAGDRYFLNVAAGGLLPELAHRVSSEAKTVLGKFAYYMEGIKEFPKQFFHPIPIQLEIQGKVETMDTLFFLAANSPYVGGFRNLVPGALVDDGLLDLLVVEAGELQDMANVFFNFLRRQVEADVKPVRGMKHYRVREFKLMSSEVVDVDTDGELGGYLPLSFTIVPKSLTLLVP
ncbi:diacylglycerol/lipid kinase family protein [Anoxynatronum buryatiense]|uniref:Diacylglycerol kinase (ATP) n=1 Tax=Anoxynatronum buryatiense TaxID=489973 RepID=A0AA45WT24_9CLOT|nr:diacylglycerol kinase family protein [Anoxynatronum buryatiense]SMP39757.1 diacylglycerol kinase (ATP) [Anoxynatronum buryatiense]